MKLKSRKLANTNEKTAKRRYNRKMVNPSNNNAEQVPPLIGGDTVTTITTDGIQISQCTTIIPTSTISTAIPSVTVSMVIPSNA